VRVCGKGGWERQAAVRVMVRYTAIATAGFRGYHKDATILATEFREKRETNVAQLQHRLFIDDRLVQDAVRSGWKSSRRWLVPFLCGRSDHTDDRMIPLLFCSRKLLQTIFDTRRLVSCSLSMIDSLSLSLLPVDYGTMFRNTPRSQTKDPLLTYP
jgi:hypothetical protein